MKIYPHVPSLHTFGGTQTVPQLPQFDPVTPPVYAAQTAETFPNSLNLVARGQAHSVMKIACLRDITTEFIDKGWVGNLDISCVANIRPSPFFTSLLGPEP